MSNLEKRKRILKMVEKGNLSAEEALLLLEKLEPDHKSIEEKNESIVTELSTIIRSERTQSQNKGNTTSVKHSLLDFVDKAFQKIKDFDLDFNFGTSLSVRHIFSHTDVFVTDIDIDVANGSVRLIPWTERDVRVECEANVYQVDSQDEARRSFINNVLFSIEDGKLKLSVQQKKMKVNSILYVPTEVYETISVRLFNGSIDGEGLRTKNFKAKTANGKITVDGFHSDKLEVETANGHITLTDISSIHVEAETINGTIRVDGSYEKLDLQSFNGNIICNVNDTKCETVLIKSTTSNIDLFIPKQRSLMGELKTNIGNFQCDLPSIERKEEKSEVVQKYLKFKTTLNEEREPLLLDIETKTGSIIIKEKE